MNNFFSDFFQRPNIVDASAINFDIPKLSMQKFLFVFLLLFPGVIFCQIKDSAELNEKIPVAFVEKVDDKVSSINDKLTKQTEKYLKKLQREEDKIKRQLQKIDSSAAANFARRCQY